MSSNPRSKFILVVILGIMFLFVLVFRNSNLPAIAVFKSHILKRFNMQDFNDENQPSKTVAVVEKVKSSMQNVPVLKFFSKTAKNVGDSVGKKIASFSNKKSFTIIQHPMEIMNRLNKKLETMRKSISKLLDLIINFPQLSGSLLFRLFVVHNDTKPVIESKESLEECKDVKVAKPTQASSWPSSTSTKSKSMNDHMAISFRDLPLNQQTMINEVTSSAVYKNKATVATALESGIVMDEFLVFRYFAAIDWAPKYHGKSVGETIESTITWRKSFGIHTIDPKEIRALAKSGLAYVSHKTDKHGRTLVYIHISRNIQAQPELLLKFLMYTVERADRASVRAGSGQFLALIDLADFSWGNCPSMSMMKSALDLLKYHYPHRLAGTYIVNTGGVFQFVWNVLKPLIPKKVLIKTFVLNGEEMKKVLDTNLGLDTLATEFGGAVNHTHFKDDKNLDSYFAAGFWPKKK